MCNLLRRHGNARNPDKKSDAPLWRLHRSEQSSITVEKGEVFGFLGPNGSGKTTVIKMLTGILPITEGDAQIEG